MNLAEKAMQDLGGIRPAARALGIPASTFAHWLDNGVPVWREEWLRERLVELADLEDLTPPWPKGRVA